MEKVKLTPRTQPAQEERIPQMDIYTDPMKDLTSERAVHLNNGQKINLKRHDPYGFWTMHWDHGTMPDKYTGQYTLFDYAMNDLKKYLSDKKLEVMKIENTYSYSAI